MKATKRKIVEIDLDTLWVLPPKNQNQAIEISYSFGLDYEGYYWRKIYDRSDFTVELSRVAAEDVLGVWDPVNEEPRATSWDVLEEGA